MPHNIKCFRGINKGYFLFTILCVSLRLTNSQRSSDSGSRGKGRGGVKPAACGPGDRRLSSHNRFSTLIDETEMEIESVPPPERLQSPGFHRQWNTSVAVRHPSLWTFIRCMKDQQGSAETSIDAANRGDNPPKKKEKVEGKWKIGCKD
ncbi:Hypothetical predicted protein [Mytilus galloprovincialis]|uniref:Uncharacterized protein n=1 Tax=Mytilus galloprovincialis TaxID=29158 RepID=A0A8B6GPD0_MYTGA|nr:Hypothetical predicted protein [Mytilus galloprovincialis]